MSQPEFLPAHHVLLNGLAALTNIILWADDRFDVIGAAMVEALPHAHDTSPRTAALAAAATGILAALPVRRTDGMRWAGAVLEANRVLANLFYWRTSSALEACRHSLAQGAEGEK
jgi:hypothetical protein